MSVSLYPLVFGPIYKEYVWGGKRIQQKFHRHTAMDSCAESWELADRPEGESVVTRGPLEGKSIHQLIAEYGPALLGTAIQSTAFPLLIKLIDAKESLSIQVHPSSESAKCFGGEAKTEAWYILDAAPGAAVYAGFKAPVTAEDIEQSIHRHTLPNLLNRIPVKNGDVIYIPGGRIHAIDRGCLMLEIQQNSNTTYRIYDWDRADEKGHPRELHVAQAMQHLNKTDCQSALILPAGRTNRLTENNECSALLQTDCFSFRHHRLTGTYDVPPDSTRFQLLFVEKGTMSVQCRTTTILQPGDTCLLPAELTECRIAPLSGCSAYLSIYPT